ncbi:MAG: Fe-S cluster assembly ATPase SufC [Alphaproteobacteria bacterium]|nr:Fe-S cluster assembly ATPase SufC [Alphaproteobacteria bacterium]MCL2890228.1 Fe-S cluster assembly ATPase SufC [Alphaproteobacteria bacterium]
MLSIKNLSVSHNDKQLLHDINLDVPTGSRLLVRGANGSGKTTLVNTIAGAADYKIESGKVTFNKKDITKLDTAARARLGIFIGAQHVPEIRGLTVTSFMKHSLMAHNPDLTAGDFFKKLTAAREQLDIPESWMARSINVGFSGGEKKRLMFLHLLLLRPAFAILDEPDSGADADAQKMFADIIKEMNEYGTTFLIISHQEKFTEMFAPTAITTLSDGRIMI